MRPLCIHHHPCADGFTAAVIINDYFGGNVDFYKGTYGEDPPDVTGRDVILADFSYKRLELLDMAAQARTIAIYDHHASAEKELADLPDNVNAVFDMNRSGAGIVWDEFYPHQDRPALVQIVEDRDLWRFKIPETRATSAALFSEPYDMAVWTTFLHDNKAVASLAVAGRAILRKQNKDIDEFLQHTTRLNIGGFNVPALNCPYMWGSEVGHILGENEPFAVYWYVQGDGQVYIGLRSADAGEDVSEVAKQYGGGGHPHAAGCRVSFDTFCGFVPRILEDIEDLRILEVDGQRIIVIPVTAKPPKVTWSAFLDQIKQSGIFQKPVNHDTDSTND